MEIIIFLLGILGRALYNAFLAYAYSGRLDRKLAERKQKKQATYEDSKKRSNFRQIDSVQGSLNTNGKDIPTYSIGDFVIDNTIGIKFYTDAGNEPVTISDVCFASNNQSIFNLPIYNLSEERKMELALNILNQKVKKTTARQVASTFKEVKELNELIRNGRIRRENNEDVTYICSY